MPSCHCRQGCRQARYCACVRAGGGCGADCSCLECTNSGGDAAAEPPAPCAAPPGPLALPAARADSPPPKRPRCAAWWGASVAEYKGALATRAAFAAAHAALCGRFQAQAPEATAAAWDALLLRSRVGQLEPCGAFGRP